MFKQALKALAVTRFVSCRFVNRVVNGVEIKLFCEFCKVLFTLTSAVFSGNA